MGSLLQLKAWRCVFMVGRSGHSMARSSDVDDNVPPLIRVRIDMSTKMVDMRDAFMHLSSRT